MSEQEVEVEQGVNPDPPIHPAASQVAQPQPQPEQGAAAAAEALHDEDVIPVAVPECAICIEPCVHPVELPCKHIFCFLCIKGVTVQARQHAITPKCSICRREIPGYVLTHPRLLEPSQLYRNPPTNEYQWFYEARSGGWWQFEERLSADLEKAFTAKQSNCQLLIAGQMYEVDFDRMIQYRSGTNGNLARKIKRDLCTASRRGVAGIRTVASAGSNTEGSAGPSSVSNSDNQAVSAQGSSSRTGPSSSVAPRTTGGPNAPENRTRRLRSSGGPQEDAEDTETTEYESDDDFDEEAVIDLSSSSYEDEEDEEDGDEEVQVVHL